LNSNDVSKEFLTVWNLLDVAYAYFGREKSPEQIKQTLHLYAQLLSDIPIDQLKQAALRHIGTSKFFPTIAELREATATLALPVQQTALEAWGEVMAALSDARYYVYTDHCEVPVFANPITNRLVASMGWRNICASDNVIADRARFVQAYEVLAERERNEAALPVQLQAGAAQPQLTAQARLRQLTGAVTTARRIV
jgi:hypothetical protein